MTAVKKRRAIAYTCTSKINEEFAHNFSEYQQAACHVGKNIGVPVLNINNAIIEIIAFDESACSKKLRGIVDENYHKLLTDSEPYR